MGETGKEACLPDEACRRGRSTGRRAAGAALVLGLLLAPLPAAAHDGHANTAPIVMTLEDGGTKCVKWRGSGAIESSNLVSGILFTSHRSLVGRGLCGTNPARAPFFDDSDGDDLTIKATVPNPPSNVSVFEGFPAVPSGALQIPATGVGTGKLLVRAQAARTSTALRVKVTASDPHGGEVSLFYDFTVFTFAGSNTPSFASTLPNVIMKAGTAVSRVLPAATGGDLGAFDTSVFSYTYSVSALPAGLTFAPATRTLSGTPTTDGFYTVTYRAEDADANTDDADAAIQTFKIAVPSSAGSMKPSFASTLSIVIVESGEVYSRVLPAATGGDHPEFGYAYSVSGLPPGLSFDPATRTISGTQNLTGPWDVTYKAHDGDSSTGDADAAIDTFTIFVTQTEIPLPPTVPSFSDGATASFSIDENHASGATVGTVAASDKDGDSLTYSLAGGGDNDSFAIDASGTITVASGITLDHEAQASYTVTARVTDGDDSGGNQETTATIDDTIPVTITVTNVEEPPGEPTEVKVAGSTPGSFTVTWKAPSAGGAPPVTDYDVRYFAGATDPGNDADWIEAGESGGHDHEGPGTHATIPGLLAYTAYRVQVRAVGDGAGDWSGSAGGRTAPAVTDADHAAVRRR